MGNSGCAEMAIFESTLNKRNLGVGEAFKEYMKKREKNTVRSRFSCRVYFKC